MWLEVAVDRDLMTTTGECSDDTQVKVKVMPCYNP